MRTVGMKSSQQSRLGACCGLPARELGGRRGEQATRSLWTKKFLQRLKNSRASPVPVAFPHCERRTEHTLHLAEVPVNPNVFSTLSFSIPVAHLRNHRQMHGLSLLRSLGSLFSRGESPLLCLWSSPLSVSLLH